jgi:hypothetical protein
VRESLVNAIGNIHILLRVLDGIVAHSLGSAWRRPRSGGGSRAAHQAPGSAGVVSIRAGASRLPWPAPTSKIQAS